MDATDLPRDVRVISTSLLQEGHRSISLGEEGECSLIRVILVFRDIIRGPSSLSMVKDGNSDRLIRSPVEGTGKREAHLEGISIGLIVRVISRERDLLQRFRQIEVLLDFPA